MTDKFRGRGWSIAAEADEDIQLGQVVSLEPTTGHGQVCQPGTRSERAIGVAWAGDFVGKVGQTEGIVASGNDVSIMTHGKVLVTGSTVVYAGDAVIGTGGGLVCPQTVIERHEKTIGCAISYCAASGSTLEILLGQG
jgi:hypothetical protein